MNLNTQPTKDNCEDLASCPIKTMQPASKPEAIRNADFSKRFRRLKANQLVSRGDFVAGERRGFEPWEGPCGFRADAFVKPVYRRDENRSTATRELE